jgi:hypothetical protein
MNASPVVPDITMKVFDLFDNKLIYEGKYEDSPAAVHMLKVFEFDITGIETQDYNPGRYYISSVTITADVW